LVKYYDGIGFFQPIFSNGVITLSAPNAIPDGSVGNEQIAEGAVTGDKIADNTIGPDNLALNLIYNYTAKFGGKFSYAGGSATVVITATGVDATYMPFVSVQSSVNAVSIEKITAGANQITVLFSGDPGASILPWVAFLSI